MPRPANAVSLSPVRTWYLEPYEAASGQIGHDFDLLIELTRGDTAEQEGLRQVQRLADAKLAELRQTIELRRTSGFEAP